MNKTAFTKGIYTAIVCWTLVGIQLLNAQKIENQRLVFDQSRQVLQIYYDVTGLNYKKELWVMPMLEVAGGKQIELPGATGAIGMISKNGKDNLIELDPFKAGIEHPEQAKIVLLNDVRKKELPGYLMIGLHGSNSAPFGLKATRLGAVGVYVGFRFGGFPAPYRYTVDNDGNIDYPQTGIYEIAREKKLASYAASGGLLIQVAKHWYGSLGVGYGAEQLFWKYNEYDQDKTFLGDAWALNEKINHKGTIAEVGLSCFFKPVYVEVGVATFALDSYQLLFGLAYVFDKR